MRCTIASKADVGEVHLHTRWWSRQVHSMWFRPSHGSVRRSVQYRVPQTHWDALLATDTFEQAMALVERDVTDKPCRS